MTNPLICRAGAARLGIALTLLLTVACKTLPVDDAQVIPSAERQTQLLLLDHWQAVGRISISSAQQALAGGIDWVQREADFRVSLTSPLGLALVVEQAGTVASVQQKGRPLVRGSSAEALILEELQVRVPLTQLAYWLRGLPGEYGEPAYDNYGRLKQLKYRDPDNIVWRADIRRYQPFAELDLPALIVVEGGGYDIRLTVREWRELTPTPTEPPQPPEKKPGTRLTIPGVSS